MSSSRWAHSRPHTSGKPRGGEGSGTESHNVRLSKALSWLLRHNIIQQGLTATKEGFVDVDRVLQLPRFRGFTAEDVEEVVRLNDKQRFALRDDPETGKRQVRANQGHTIRDIDPSLTPITSATDYPRVIHGTYLTAWNGGIRQRGLSRMKRNHIHFAKGELGDEGVISGMRKDCDVFIHVDMEKAMEAGFVFSVSENGVVLCPGDATGHLPVNVFKKVIHRKKDGEESELYPGC